MAETASWEAVYGIILRFSNPSSFYWLAYYMIFFPVTPF